MIKSLEERIVNLTKVTADGKETTVEAELRQLKMQGGIPSKCTVVLAKEIIFNLVWIGILLCLNSPTNWVDIHGILILITPYIPPNYGKLVISPEHPAVAETLLFKFK